jgi:hypothetical protein
VKFLALIRNGSLGTARGNESSPVAKGLKVACYVRSEYSYLHHPTLCVLAGDWSLGAGNMRTHL